MIVNDKKRDISKKNFFVFVFLFISLLFYLLDYFLRFFNFCENKSFL